MSTQTKVKIAFIGGGLIIQVVLNVALAALMCKKKKYRVSDPIQSSLATARQHTKQLNRINLLAFIMSVQYMLSNLPQLIAPSIYWTYLANNRIDYGTLKLIVKIIDLTSLFLVASRSFIVCMASPKIRREAYLALTCTPETNDLAKFGINIKPNKNITGLNFEPSWKQKSFDSSLEQQI